MCGSFFGGGGAPSMPPPPPIRPAIVRRQPRLADEGVAKAREDTKSRARQAFAGTLLTGGGGLSTTANTQKKTLLGA